MNNFVFQNPTKLVFGKGQIAQLSTLVPKDKKILITFGSSSVRSNGVYDQVISALKHHNIVEFWGIEPNPTVETLRKAVAIGKQNSVDFVLAVGGGSVIDGSKLISASILNESDPWDLVLNPSLMDKTIPLATVLTLPATGSEMNKGAVISNTSTDEKFAFYSNYPVFSILDPQATFSLPEFQIACGIADTFVHTMEQYMTTAGQSPLMDRWAEGILSTLIEIAPKIKADKQNYELMSTFMLSATMALNGFIAMGVSQDWATHMIGHEITALTGTTHGASLAIVYPATMRVMTSSKKEKILQFGQRVFGINEGSETQRIEQTIKKTEEFFRSLGLATRLSELNIGQDVIEQIVERFKNRGSLLGENADIDFSKVADILSSCRTL